MWEFYFFPAARPKSSETSRSKLELEKWNSRARRRRAS